MKSPFRIIGFQRRARFDEKRHKDLGPFQEILHLWIGQRASPNLKIATFGGVAMNDFPGRHKVLGRGIILNGLFILGQGDECVLS